MMLLSRLKRMFGRRGVVGHVDGYSNGRLYGWAQDPAAPDRPVVLRVVSGATVLEVVANIRRRDVVRSGAATGSGNIGFSVPAAHLSAATCRVYVAATGEELPGSPLAPAAGGSIGNVVSGPAAEAGTPEIHLASGFAELLAESPPTALDVPSMMSVEERTLLYGLARRHFRGDGVIVDGGIFLGASTRCFADGLRANPALAKARTVTAKPIVSFEKGSTNPGMIPFFERHHVPLTPGIEESFLPVLQKNLEPVMDMVDLRVGDITQTAESLDLPVEICFLDVLKLPHISIYCLAKFFPRLIPGHSIVVQQDYFYDLLPYIKTHQELMREHFTFLGEINSSAVFLCTSAVPAEKLEALHHPIPYEDQLMLADVAAARTRVPRRRFMMALSKLRIIRRNAGKKAARAYYETIKADFPEQMAEKDNARLVDAIAAAEKILT